jgi:hypothetical protein
MKVCIFVLVSFTGNLLFGQKEISDTIKTIRLDEVETFANRLSILLKNNPGAISLVTPEILSNIDFPRHLKLHLSEINELIKKD